MTVAPNSFFALLLLFAFVLAIFATILGWIAAARIRESDGKRYGFRLAAFSALFFPTLLLLSLTLFFSAFAIRFDLIVGLAVLLTLVTLSIQLFRVLLRNIRGRSGFREVFGFKKNRVIYGCLVVLWMVAGVVIFLQRPQQIDEVIVSESPDGIYQAEASTWRRMQIFGPDRLSYRFSIRSPLGGMEGKWSTRVPLNLLSQEHFLFSKNGRINWTENNQTVFFFVKEEKVFQVDTGSMRWMPSHPNAIGSDLKKAMLQEVHQ